ncbi:retrovirus-related pol polyprotein from transposon TNT 1-94 [Tanacetum coccineum]
MDGCYRILYYMMCKKEDHRTSDHDMYNVSLKRSENYIALPYQYASPSKQILKAKAKPFTPCTHYGFNYHRPDDCRNYTECEIYGSYDHFTSGHIRVILVRGGAIAESFQSSESSIDVRYNICGSTVNSTNDHNDFDHFKRGSPSSIRTVDDQGFDDKQGIIFNANKEIVLIALRRNDVHVLDMSSPTPNGACFFAKASKKYKLDKSCSACEKGKHKRASFKTKQNFSIRKCLHLLHMDLFGPVSLMSINHEKYTLVIVDEYSRMVENKNDVKVKQIRTDNGTKFRNRELESFCDEKGISQNFSSPYYLNKMVYFHVFGCPVFIYNHKDHLGKFDFKADDGYFLGYSYVSIDFRVFNIRRQQLEETYHVTFDETNSDISYYVIPHGRSLTELTQEKHVPKVITLNEPGIPHIEDVEGPPDRINTEENSEQNVQDEKNLTYSTEGLSGNNTEVSVSVIKSLVSDVPRSQISNQASTSSHFGPQDRWSKDQHIKLVNIIGNPGEGMLIRSMAAKLTTVSASECLFADFLSEIEPKKVFEALKHPGWIDTMQEELNQFYKNKVWTLVPLSYGKIAIGFK